ncbi:MAG: class I SAM-dependent methyltransferase [Methylomonas sp.]|jgi:SAM-dependent methyltransferase
MCSLKNILKKVIGKISPKNDYVVVDGSIIPSPDKRWCGPEFKDDVFYIKSAEKEANRLVKFFQCNIASRILDIGCGQGRLANGLLRVVGEVNYVGMDVDQFSVNWCENHIGKQHGSFRFKYLDLYNERYNVNGQRITDNFQFDIESNSMDIIYLFSVFSHTIENDMRVYLKDFLRILNNDGKVFFTTFVEENVENFTINPENYRLNCSGPLHIVRYNKEYLFSLLNELGYSILDFTYETETDGQSAIYLCKKEA